MLERSPLTTASLLFRERDERKGIPDTITSSSVGNRVSATGVHGCLFRYIYTDAILKYRSCGMLIAQATFHTEKRRQCWILCELISFIPLMFFSLFPLSFYLIVITLT